MSIVISEEINQALQKKDTIKVIASISKQGVPHVTVKDTISITSEGQILYYELLETSQTQKNLVNSIWFNKKIAVNIITSDKKSYQLKGVPIKAVIAGSEFLDAYEYIQNSLGKEYDLSTLWHIEIQEAYEETLSVRKETEENLHPYELHVDRLAI